MQLGLASETVQDGLAEGNRGLRPGLVRLVSRPGGGALDLGVVNRRLYK